MKRLLDTRLHAGQPQPENSERPACLAADAMVVGASPKLALLPYCCPSGITPHLTRKKRRQSMQKMTLSLPPRAFATAMPANGYGLVPEYTSAMLRTLRPRHVSPPSILGNNPAIRSANHSGWPTSAEAPARVDGVSAEYAAYTPSTSRSLDKERYR